jgi:hypothetical protein
MERYTDIVELLEFVTSDIALIAEEYEAARKDEEQSHVLRPRIKACFENLRSALEYSAQDIWASYTRKKNSVYFPYGKDEKCFTSSVNKNLPALKEQAPEVFNLVENLQPHKSGDDWLYVLCKHTNFNKHNRLSGQVRKNSSASSMRLGNVIRVEGEGSMAFVNCYVNDQPMSKNETFILSSTRKVSEMSAELSSHVPIVREFEWVEFELEGSVYDIMKIISKSHANISSFVSELRTML